jgi:3-isopropylmalate/(R)-2-methylmalate dehydratase large subunit
MGMTMAQMILAKAAGEAQVEPGDVIEAKIHALAMIDSSTFWFDWFTREHLRVWDPARVIFCFDHLQFPGFQKLHAQIRELAREQGIPPENVYDLGRHGLSHQIPAEDGWALPGTFFVTHDTQGATMGALNCYAMPALEAVGPALATGKMWLTVPDSIKVTLYGKLPRLVLGKDIYLRLLLDLASVASGRVLEFDGPGMSSIPIDVRMAIANGSPHIGVDTMIFAPDRRLLEYVTPRARTPFQTVSADQDAQYVARHDYDLAEFRPLVSGPDDPRSIRPLDEVRGIKIHAAYVGSCNGGRMEDLLLAAEALRGKRVHPGVRMVVTPISSKVWRDAADLGLLDTFAAAGATVTTPGCGACFYGNMSPLRLSDGEVCITASVENWPGRMGSDSAKIYLANAGVVAASAVSGEIAGMDEPDGVLT